MKLFLTGIKVTQAHGFNRAAIAAYWKRKYRGKVKQEPWYLLTWERKCHGLRANKIRLSLQVF
jgi:hypothetical protein